MEYRGYKLVNENGHIAVYKDGIRQFSLDTVEEAKEEIDYTLDNYDWFNDK